LAARRPAAERFLRFFADETVRHFRQEEEMLFPALVESGAGASDLLVRALLEHQRMHALVARLDRGLAAGVADPALMNELGQLLDEHVRLEERQLFPLIEDALSTDAIGELDLGAGRAPETPVVDLLGPRGRGPLWGTQTDDLNATLLAWDAGGGPSEHVNAERDVVLVVLAGSAIVTVEGERRVVQAGAALVIEKGRARSITGGPDGVRYLSIHRRRSPLQIARTTT
jgi:quercetin dioxygenase-like cupin family protein